MPPSPSQLFAVASNLTLGGVEARELLPSAQASLTGAIASALTSLGAPTAFNDVVVARVVTQGPPSSRLRALSQRTLVEVTYVVFAASESSSEALLGTLLASVTSTSMQLHLENALLPACPSLTSVLMSTRAVATTTAASGLFPSPPPPSKPRQGSVSPGAIAAIVVCTVAGLLLLGLGSAWYVRRRRAKQRARFAARQSSKMVALEQPTASGSKSPRPGRLSPRPGTGSVELGPAGVGGAARSSRVAAMKGAGALGAGPGSSNAAALPHDPQAVLVTVNPLSQQRIRGPVAATTGMNSSPTPRPAPPV